MQYNEVAKLNMQPHHNIIYLLINLHCSFGALTEVINTTYGPVQGTITHDGRVRQFLSIPYAAPPIDNLRWQNPQLHQPWSTTYNATQQPWGCPQICGNSGIKDLCPPYIREDCLILSIFTPNIYNTRSINTTAKNKDTKNPNANKKSESEYLYPIMNYLMVV